MSTSAQVATTRSVGGFTTGVRYALVVVAGLFVIAVVAQIFLAGLMLFESSGYRNNHVDFGHMIGPLAYLLPILGLIGRIGWQRIIHAFATAVIYQIQAILPIIDAGFIAALHPLNAFLVLGAALALIQSVLGLIRSQP